MTFHFRGAVGTLRDAFTHLRRSVLPRHKIRKAATMLEELLGAMNPVLATVKHIVDDEPDKVSDEDLKLFLGKVLVPLKPRIEEILADPKNAKLSLGRATVPTAEQIDQLQPDSLSADDCYHYIGTAMMCHAGQVDSLSGLKRATRIARLLYCGQRAEILTTKNRYLDQDENDRPGNWVHDAIGVGAVEIDGKDMVIHPLRAAVKNALAWLRTNPGAPTKPGEGGGRF